jgi:hypothetical protein
MGLSTGAGIGGALELDNHLESHGDNVLEGARHPPTIVSC